MSLNPAFSNPAQVDLEINPNRQTQLWQTSQSFATPVSQWNAYLNALCLDTLMPWFREESLTATPALRQAGLEGIWEVVGGTVITVDGARLLLWATEVIDLDELRIPQEWVDLPTWIADYYLLVQVNPDDHWLRVGGWVTHHQLKTQGHYDWRDRTYSLDESALNPDLGALQVAHQLNPVSSTRALVAALSPLPLAQAESLLRRLSNPEILHPRLEIPFEQWGALCQHDGWRHQLMRQRRRQFDRPSVSQWIQRGIAGIEGMLNWAMDWATVQYQPDAVGARGDDTAAPITGIARQLAIAGQAYELRVIPLTRGGETIWRFELQNLIPGASIPAGFVLRLLTEDLQPFEGNEDRAETAVEQLYIELALAPGEGIVWAIEPTPDQYESEILWF